MERTPCGAWIAAIQSCRVITAPSSWQQVESCDRRQKFAFRQFILQPSVSTARRFSSCHLIDSPGQRMGFLHSLPHLPSRFSGYESFTAIISPTTRSSSIAPSVEAFVRRKGVGSHSHGATGCWLRIDWLKSRCLETPRSALNFFR